MCRPVEKRISVRKNYVYLLTGLVLANAFGRFPLFPPLASAAPRSTPEIVNVTTLRTPEASVSIPAISTPIVSRSKMSAPDVTSARAIAPCFPSRPTQTPAARALRKLIDERNDYMAEQIRTYAEKYDNIVVVVGDFHVEGLTKLLEGKEIRKIRLGDILNKDSLDKIKAEVWNR